MTYLQQPRREQRAELEEQLIERLRESYAMESSVYDVLAEMSAKAANAEIWPTLEAHKQDARHHRQRLAERLEVHGERALARDGSLAVWLKLASSLARDGSLAVRLKLASYDRLERIAERAGDDQTAEVARRNRAGERALARTIASNPQWFAERLEADGADV